MNSHSSWARTLGLLLTLLAPGVARAEPPTPETVALCQTLLGEEAQPERVQALLAAGADPAGPCEAEVQRRVPIERGPTASQSIRRSLHSGRGRGGLLAGLILLPVLPVIAVVDGIARATGPSSRLETVTLRTTPLHAAVAAQDLRSLSILLEAGADPLVVDDTGASAFLLSLAFAVSDGEEASLRALLDWGLSMEALAPHDPWLVLRVAEQPELLELLCAHGLDPDASAEGQRRALHHAVDRGDGAVIERLLACGADPGRPGYPGELPVDVALRRQDPATLELLIAHGASLQTEDDEGRAALMRAVDGGSHWAIEELIRLDVDLEQRDIDGATPLYHAARLGQVQATTLLLEAGADVTAADKVGWTPLVLAVYERRVELTRLLLEHGAPVDAAVQRWVIDFGSLDVRHRSRDPSSWMEVTALLLAHGLPVEGELLEIAVDLNDAAFAAEVFAHDQEGSAWRYRRLKRRARRDGCSEAMIALLTEEVQARRGGAPVGSPGG